MSPADGTRSADVRRGLAQPTHEADTEVVLLNCEMIVRSAAYASDCGVSIFFSGIWTDLKVAVQFDAEGPCRDIAHLLVADRALIARVAALDPGEILIIEDRLSQDHLGIVEGAGRSGAGLRFIAAIQVLSEAGRVLGALVIADEAPRSGLSLAQQYVLRTHAAQLATLRDLRALREQVSRQGTNDTERLRLLESVVVNANDAVLITEAEPIDLPGPRIVYVNRAFEETTGYSAEEVLGKTPRILQSDAIDRTSLHRLKDALASWKPVEVELLNRRKDGTEFWVELSIVPVANARGWYTHWVSVQRDVSDRKLAEEITTRARIAEAENRAFEAEIRERRRVEAQLLYEAFHDHLTKLHNRAFFMERLTLALGKSGDDGKVRNTILFLDLDRFKLVNDSLGHRAGDQLLIVAARRLKECVREEDVVARIGGDEFAVLLEDDDLQSGIELAECIIRALRQPITLDMQRVFPSCSIGIAQSGVAPLKADEFLRNADIAMYQAKKRGLGGYAIFAESMHADVSATLALQTDLRQAVARNEFRLYYQLICNPANSLITGVEALLRWQHPVRGLVSPMTFIPMAEEIGVIRDIGRWVLQEACNQLRVWNQRFSDLNLLMSVNVSGDELHDPAFVSELQTIVVACGLEPKRLQLEITESVFLREPELIGRVLETIRATGVRIALDDFGTGFSSLAYIDQYPIDAIKIDRSFVAAMLTRHRTLAIIETIIKLGTALNLQIIAEGVETDEQRKMLTSLACAHGQGYLFAEPVAADAMTPLIEKALQTLRQSEPLALQRQLGAAWG